VGGPEKCRGGRLFLRPHQRGPWVSRRGEEAGGKRAPPEDEEENAVEEKIRKGRWSPRAQRGRLREGEHVWCRIVAARDFRGGPRELARGEDAPVWRKRETTGGCRGKKCWRQRV